MMDRFRRAYSETLRLNSEAGFLIGRKCRQADVYDLPRPRLTDEPLNLSMRDARANLEQCAIAATGSFQWQQPYSAVGDWLRDTQGKSIVITGAHGTGKTLLAKVIAGMMYARWGILFTIAKGSELNDHADALRWSRFTVLDDIGWEDQYSEYGNRRWVFGEIVDAAATRGGVLVITSSKSWDELTQHYGTAIIGRLARICMLADLSGCRDLSGIPEQPLDLEASASAPVNGLAEFKKYWATVPDEEKYATFTTEDGRVVPLHPVAAIARLAFSGHEH